MKIEIELDEIESLIRRIAKDEAEKIVDRRKNWPDALKTPTIPDPMSPYKSPGTVPTWKPKVTWNT